MIWNEWGIMGARGPRANAGGGPPAAGVPGVAAGAGPCGGAGAAGVGPNSAVMRRMWPVFASRVNVLARAGVGTVCSTLKLVGDSSLMTVSVPSPCELKRSEEHTSELQSQ